MNKCKLCKKKYKWGKYADKKHIESGVCSDCWNKEFQITSICRVDLPEEIDMSKMDDTIMNTLADKMADGFGDDYWENLEYALEYIKELIDKK